MDLFYCLVTVQASLIRNVPRLSQTSRKCSLIPKVEEAVSNTVQYQFDSDSEYVEKESEVFEVSQEEWDKIAQKHLDKLGLTRSELERRINSNSYTVAEFKAWMIVYPSTIK